MKSLRRIATAVAVAGLVAACATAAAIGSPTKSVTISVASLIPGSTQAAVDQFNAQVKEFENANPTIKVNAVEYQWTAPTFAAKLAAGTLPTVFEVPFTDARTLGDNGQLALHYNRALFKAAGLDPNKPPTTWTQLRADAKQIAQKTGKAGYVEMAKDDNTAGWILTTVVYSLGGRMEVGTGTNAKATLDNPKTIQALNLLKAMRWTDNSMGSNFNYSWGDINQAFAAGTIGMYISGSDVYTNLVQASNINPGIYGLGTIPLAKSKNAGVLGGGTLVGVRPDANAAAKAAAVKWIDFFYESPLVSKSQAIRNAQTLVANKQPVGVPALPLFNKQQYDLANTWIKPYINVPLTQMKPFLTGIFGETLVPEPEAATQSVYHSLDAVVEAVLTNKNTNVVQMLQQANSTAQAAIQQGS